MRRQGSQVSMRVARASASWLSSRGRGLGPQDTLTPALSGRVPGLPSTPQDEAGLTRKFETSPVGVPTCRKTPISLSALEKNPQNHS